MIIGVSACWLIWMTQWHDNDIQNESRIEMSKTNYESNLQNKLPDKSSIEIDRSSNGTWNVPSENAQWNEVVNDYIGRRCIKYNIWFNWVSRYILYNIQ